MPAPFLAYKKADVGIFRSFLLCKEVNLEYINYGKKKTMLHAFFDEMKHKSYHSIKLNEIRKELTENEKKCFDHLLKHEKCDRDFINAQDENSLPCIHYAIKYKIDYMVMELLRSGANIELVVKNLRKGLFEDFLNSCITTNNRLEDDNEFEIKIDYRFLIPALQSKCDSATINSIQKTPQESKISMPVTNEKFSPELRPLKKIAENEELKQFLLHPVLSSFVLLKWNKINFLIYINLFFIIFYMLTFIPYNVICQTMNKEERNESFYYHFFKISSFISLTLLIFRESTQFLMSIKKYVCSKGNWIDMTFILSSLVILIFEDEIPKHPMRVLRTVIILLAVTDYFNLLGLLPLMSISLYTKMFRKVAWTFVKSLAFYSVMILGFAFSFYTLHGDKFAEVNENFFKNGRDNNTNDMPATNGTRSERYNNFNTVWLSIIKNYVMLTGELEASYMHLEGPSYAALFLLFIFLVTIVLYNLLNALAVSDTQEIKSDAKLIDLHQRIFTMEESEEAIFKRNSRASKYFKEIISLFPKTIQNGSIKIMPNGGNRVMIGNDHSIVYNEWLPNSLDALKTQFKFDSEIVQDLKNLFVKRREEQIISNARRLKENRIEKLSMDLMENNKMMIELQQKIIELQLTINELKN